MSAVALLSHEELNQMLEEASRRGAERALNDARDMLQPKRSELIGFDEVCQILDMGRTKVREIQRTDSRFPKMASTAGMKRPKYKRFEVEKYARDQIGAKH